MVSFKHRILFTFLSSVLICTAGQAADWRHDLEDVNTKRDALFKEQQPGLVLRPLSEKSSAVISGETYGIAYERPASSEDKRIIYASLIQTAIMHPRDHFFEQPLAEKEIKDARYYGHITACYIVHTATQILEGANQPLTVGGLSQNLATYFQRLLSYKETALQTLSLDKKVSGKILDEVARYDQVSYQRLLTENFVSWYQGISSQYYKDRGRYGIKMGDLPPPPAKKRILDVTFQDGMVVTYSGRGEGMLFNMSGGGFFPMGFSSNGQTGEMNYKGVHFDLNLPLSSLQPALSRIGATAQSREEDQDLESLYMKKASEFDYAFLLEPAQIIKACRSALVVSDIYRAFGVQRATEDTYRIEETLGDILHQDTATYTPEKKFSVFCEMLGFFEHRSLPRDYMAQRAQRNLEGILQEYGNYLLQTTATIPGRAAALRRASVIFKEAQRRGFPNAQQSLLMVERAQAQLLAPKK